MGANKALPVFAGIIVLMVIVVAYKAFHKERGNKALTLKTVPVAPKPDADSPADTVRTLTAYVAELKAQSQSIERQNNQLLNQKQDLTSSLKATLSEELKKQAQAPSPEVQALQAEVMQLRQTLQQLSAAQPSPAVPVNYEAPLAPDTFMETLQWVEPLGAIPASGNSFAAALNNAAAPANLPGTALAPTPVPKSPRFTVPRNATLVGSTAMTALIGKVPFKDTISDPFPFKVLVGKDNLAANGVTIPGLNGMVFSGHSSGDWTLGCVRGNVDAVTFVFEDGTIRTLPEQNMQSGNNMLGNAQRLNTQDNLGWISDKRGIPCISGQRISNAQDFLAGRISARAAEAAAKAFAQSNITQGITPVGGVLNAITGSAPQYAGLNALAGGADEISQYLKERAAQSFDVVYVDTGVELAIHIDRELPIDYDPSGRKTTYDVYSTRNTAAFD